MRHHAVILIASLSVVSIVTLACTSGEPSSTGPGPAPTCSSPLASVLNLPVGADTAIDPASDSGCVTFPGMASASDSAEYLVVAQSAGGIPGDTASFQLRSARLSAGLTAMRRQVLLNLRGGAHGSVAAGFERFRLGLERRSGAGATGQVPSAPHARPATITKPVVGSLRTFTVCSNLDCTAFQPVTARAVSVGAHVAIYVDTLSPADGLSATDIDTLQQVFDTHVYAVDTVAFGGVSDIDSNGVVLTLMTPVVNRIVSASECAASGYVAGFFYPPDLDPTTAAQYNDGEIFYTVVADPNGALSCPHTVSDLQQVLPGTFLHELQHVIGYNQHVLLRGGPPEDLWLDESLSSFAEELGGRSFLPDTATFSTYVTPDLENAYGYLLDPGDHFLLQTSDTVLEDFGAGWMFVRYLVDQYGPTLTNQLEQTTLTGTANVAAQTGVPFTTVATRWALANWVSDLPGFAPPVGVFYRSWSFRAVFASFNAQDPYDFPIAFPLQPPLVSGLGVDVAATLHAGSGFYVDIHQAPGAAAFTLRFGSGLGLVTADVTPRLAVIRIH